MFRNILIIFTLLSLFAGLTALNSMDFYPPSLKKVLQKADSTTTQLKELTLSENAQSQIPMGKFYGISSAPRQFVYIGRVNACRAGGCMDPSPNARFGDEYEYFDYFILFDSAYSVQEVKVYNYQATHGQEITSKNWLKQFRRYVGSKRLITGKNIDGISGATISVEAIVYDIEQKTNLLREEAPR
ncbi:MAG TPA: FMN-binding protein [Bacteroidales bacterium]|nr:FMN-binding protein [Bacteroidales bacterium]